MPSLEQLQELGRVISEARQERGLSLKEAGARGGLSHNYIWLIERMYAGKGRSPTVPSEEKLVALARALDLPLRRLQAILGQGGPESATSRLARQSRARALVQEHLAEHDPDGKLTLEAMAALVEGVDRFVERGVKRRLRQLRERPVGP